MNNRAMSLALVIALFSVYLVWSWVSEVEEKAQKRYGATVRVLKAKQDIKETETINTGMLELEAIPKTFLEPSSVYFDARETEEETNKSVKAIEGSVALVPIKKGEQISYNKITEPGIRTGLSPQVAPGRRAMSIPVSDQSSVSRLVRPGDRVDLIAVIDMGGGKDSKIAKTVIQDVVILSVGKNVTNNIPRVLEADGNKERYRSVAEDTSYNTVSVEIDPTQAQMLALILSNGENALTLSLRNNDDTERSNLGTSMLSDVLGADVNRAQRGLSGKR